MKARIIEVTIDFEDKQYRVNTYGPPEWKIVNWTYEAGYFPVEDDEVPKEVRDARRRAQSA